MAHNTRYMFEIYDQKLIVSRFMAVFMSYCPQFWGSRAIYNNLKTRYMLERYDPKLVIFVFFGHFHELFPIVFGSQAELQGMQDPIHVGEIWPKTRRFRVLWPFSWVISHSFLVLCGFARPVRPVTCLRDMTKNRCFRVLWPFSWAIAHYFGVLGPFTTTLIPDACWRDMTQNSSCLCFMAVFMSYWPHFWGSMEICMGVQKTPYMFEICQETRHFRILWLFNELLPTILGF